MDALKLLGLIEDLDRALQGLSEAQAGQDPLQLLSAIEAVDAALLALGTDVSNLEEEDNTASEPEDNPLYTSIIQGDIEVNLDLLNQVRDEAIKDPKHPQLIPAVKKMVDIMKKNTEE